MPSGPGSGHYQSTDSAVRIIAFIVDGSNDPSTGDTVVYALYSCALGQRLDFDDSTFKAGSHTTATASMSQLDATNLPGVYLATLDLSAITNLSANDTLIALPTATTGKDPPPVEIRVDGWMAKLVGGATAYVLDGGSGNSSPTYDSRGMMTAGRIRIFASPAAASAATAGAANDADGEIDRITITAATTTAGRADSLTLIGQ